MFRPNRRGFFQHLGCAVVAASLFSMRCEAFPRGGSSFQSAFRGNPNPTITAINTSGGIASSVAPDGGGVIQLRTPGIVQVSASAITATGTSVPFEDLWFDWNFGDTSGAETFTNPGTRGGPQGALTTVNANNNQIGPEAAYCYRSPGSYVITLTIRGKNGSGYTVATVTRNVTVTAYSAGTGGEWWVDSAAAGGGSGTIGSPFNSIADINAKVASGTDIWIHIKKGSSFSGATAIEIGGSGNSTGVITGLRIDTYGSGAAPSIQVTSGSGVSVVHMYGGSGGTAANKQDIVISGLNLSLTGTAVGNVVDSVLFPAGGTHKNIYFDNCTLNGSTDGSTSYSLQCSTAQTLSGWGLWNCAAQSPASPVASTTGIYTQGGSWFMVFAGSVTGGTGSATTPVDFNHHIYPIVQQHALFNWISFSNSNTSRNFCINYDWEQVGGALNYAEFFLMSECSCAGARRVHDASEGTNVPTNVQFRNMVCQLNRINTPGDAVVFFYGGISYTHRYNEAWGVDGGSYYRPSSLLASLLVSRFYGNKIYRTINDASSAVFDFASATLLQTITDETYQSTQTTTGHVTIGFSAQAGATINRNKWYAASATTSTAQFNDGATLGKSFLNWQAAGFDAAGQVANPGWTSPATGNFGPVTA